MPPESYNAITESDEVYQQVLAVFTAYECDSIADAVATASTVALERDEADLAQILADRLAE
jgi:hypothetical protein